MQVVGPIPTPGLRSLLEFEAAKHGVAISYSVCDLRDFTVQNFVPQVDVIAHQGDKEVKFHLDHQGVGLDLTGDIFFQVGKLILVQDQPVAVVFERFLFLAFDPEILLTSTHPDPARLVNSLMGQVLDQAMGDLVQSIRSYSFQDEATRYGEFRMNADEERTKQWNRDLRSNDFEIEAKASELRELYRKNAEIREWITMRQEYTTPHRRRTFEADYLALMKMVPEAASKVEFDENEVRVTTKPVVIEYENMDYEMGAYVIVVNFRTLDLRITNVGRTDKDFPHPHVSTDGVPCLGNLAPGVQRLLADGDFAGLIQVILMFLASYNRKNPYLKIESWDPDFDDGEEERDRFERCYSNSSSRECVACGDEDCPYSYDAEENCFEGASIRDCISCGLSSCGHRQEAVTLCREDHNCWECRACDNDDCSYAGDEDECHEASDGQLCGDCDQTDCKYYPEPEDDEDEETETESEGKENADEARS